MKYTSICLCIIGGGGKIPKRGPYCLGNMSPRGANFAKKYGPEGGGRILKGGKTSGDTGSTSHF